MKMEYKQAREDLAAKKRQGMDEKDKSRKF
jgi:hypothetical protein